MLLNALFPLDIDRLNKPKSVVVYDKFGELIYISLSSDGFVRVPIEGEIPKSVKDALCAYEDRYFFYHFGINPIALIKAAIFDITHSRKIGASTISMQVARMMHHRPRTITSKIIEMFEALQLEWRYSKDEILKFYLNNAPFGGNIEGIESASRVYFDLPLKSLSTAQISYLISIPKNPNKNAPSPKNRKRVNILKKRVLTAMLKAKKITKEQFLLALKEPIYPKRAPLINEIPTLSRYFKAGINKSSIDLRAQRLLRDSLLRGLKRVNTLKIYNASGIIIDNFSKKIIAYVGSANFWDNNHSNKIDGLKAIISPGSTLKPFIYAKAFEKGIITPKKYLFDIKYFIGGFEPANFDNRFIGKIEASKALAYSRNIPAVWLNSVLRDDSLFELLKKANIKSINKPKSFYGDAIALGGCGIRVLDLANLYSALATDGEYERATFLESKKSSKRVKLISKEASWLVLEALALAPRVRFDSSWEFLGKKKIAYKTGTSANSKDMLSIGVTPKYTVAIWFGNFDRKFGSKSFDKKRSGLSVATPVMEEVFEGLEKDGWFKRPKNIIKKRVCVDAIVINRCKIEKEDFIIKGTLLHTPCEVLTPNVLLRLIKQKRIKSINDLKGNLCFSSWKSYKPVIEGLSNNKTYIKNRLLPKELKKIALRCYSFDENSTIFWLINDKEPIKWVSGKALFIYLPPDEYTIRCIDMQSREAKVEFKLEEM